ncbi:hypothetical protein D3C85_1681520 [compost metagenome]
MIWVAVSRSLLKNSWMTWTTNSMGVKSSLSSTTWNIWGGLTRCARRSSTTESSLPTLGGATGLGGFLGFWVAMNLILAAHTHPLRGEGK